jgi:molybdenum cofactor cytidylyltransferase
VRFGDPHVTAEPGVTSEPVVAVLLAAGGGSRFTGSGGIGHKLLADAGGRPVVARAVEAALGAGLDEVLVVSGAVDLAGALADLPVRLVHNPRWADGIATSLRSGIEVAASSRTGAVVVGLGDQPGVPSAAWRAVADHPGPEPLVVATYGGTRGNPVRLAREIWDEVPRSGDEGARVLLRRRPDLVAEVACDGDPRDVDTVEDLDRWS